MIEGAVGVVGVGIDGKDGVDHPGHAHLRRIAACGCAGADRRLARGRVRLRLQRIERASHGAATELENVRVDHGGAHVAVAEQFLHGADVVAGLQQMRGERMAPMSIWS